MAVLTRRGWKTHERLVEGDETLGLHHQTRRLRWTRIVDVQVRDDVEVFEVGSRAWSVQAAADHRWIAADPATGSYGWTTTASRKQAPWVVAAPMADGPGLHLTGDEAELLGWLVTDGSQWEGSQFCAFAGCANTATGKGLCGSHRRQQRQGKSLKPLRAYPRGQTPGFSLFAWQVKPAGVARLAAILGDNASFNGKGYRLRDAYAHDLLARAGLTDIKDAAQLLVAVHQMTGVQRAAMLVGVIGGDGTAGGRRVLQNAGPLCDFIAALVYLCGHRPRVVGRNMVSAWSPGTPMAITLSRPRVSVYRREPQSLGLMGAWSPRTEEGSWTGRFEGSPVLTGGIGPLT